VVSLEGFKFVNEGKAGKPKWGYVSTAVGSKLRIRLNTTLHSPSVAERPDVLVYVAHLKSYKHMGTASVKWAAGCCAAQLLPAPPMPRLQLRAGPFPAAGHRTCCAGRWRGCRYLQDAG
jgi:hypothetical protein